MLRDFETALADALGSRLPPPLQGAVDAAPARDAARIVVALRAAEPVDDELLSRRPERVPGAADPRRVLRLRCELGLEIRAGAGGTRADQVAALDGALYALGEPALADGRALLPDDADADPGFVIQRLALRRVDSPALLLLEADGWFWPAGEAGAAGVAIRELRLRQSLLPLRLLPDAPFVAGGGAVELRLRFGAAGTMRLRDGAAPAGEAFGSVVLALTDAGGRPGAGALSGGAAGAGGARVVAVAGGEAVFGYTPPPAAARDFLVVRVDEGAGAPGQTLGRLPLTVRGA